MLTWWKRGVLPCALVQTLYPSAALLTTLPSSHPGREICPIQWEMCWEELSCGQYSAGKVIFSLAQSSPSFLLLLQAGLGQVFHLAVESLSAGSSPRNGPAVGIKALRTQLLSVGGNGELQAFKNKHFWPSKPERAQPRSHLLLLLFEVELRSPLVSQMLSVTASYQILILFYIMEPFVLL